MASRVIRLQRAWSNACLVLADRPPLVDCGGPGDHHPLVAARHTDGSVVVALDGGDVIAGDLVRSGHVGGALLPHRPLDQYYCDHPRTRAERVAWLLSLRPERIHPGHGGVLDPATVAARWHLDLMARGTTLAASAVDTTARITL